MEVGAVKQAFNNELILLKKKLNQAKTQIIHKLTRKAKTLVDKKAPEPLQEKFKRKAESAVKEVLIIKKIKVRDVGRFIITHTKQLQDHLNKPEVDQDKACARLLLHKSLADKYKYFRNKFSDIPIDDLFMSRQERRKIKKEARELQKNKNKAKRDKRDAKNKVVNAEGDWNVEDVKTRDGNDKENSEFKSDDDQGSDDDKQVIDDESESGGEDIEVNSDYDSDGDDAEYNVGPKLASKYLEKSKTKLKSVPQKTESRANLSDSDGNESEITSDNQGNNIDDDDLNSESNDENERDDADSNANTEITVKSLTKKDKSSHKTKVNKPETKIPAESAAFELKLGKHKEKPKIKSEKKLKDNKNKNLKDKIQHNKFKKDSNETAVTESKIVDPFFITSTGENYMSVVEVRPPDEVKDEHRQGNRQLRRARMFGHVPKIKPKSNFKQNNRFEGQNGFDKRNNSGKSNGYQSNKLEGYKQKDGNTTNFKNRENKRSNFKERTSFEDRDSFKKGGFKRTFEEESKPEKLHPSWEAKKKQSGILPFQGKKIVFDEG